MIRILGTVFAALMGLAFGSFLNVCLTRWPAGESIVKPHSHCRNCGRTLAWWENVPLVSWLALRGRCRTCGTWIGWQYVIVEAALGGIWGLIVWQQITWVMPSIFFAAPFDNPHVSSILLEESVATAASKMILTWLLVALAALDAENLWLPDWLTIPGVFLGLIFFVGDSAYRYYSGLRAFDTDPPLLDSIALRLAAVAAAAGLILLIRWIYKLIRHREGLGLGDAKLMAMLAAWLGLSGALLSFAIGVVLGSFTAIVMLVRRKKNEDSESWAGIKLPLGTFLCIGGIVTSLWGQPIIAAYLRWARF